MRIKFMYEGLVIYSGSTADLLYRLYRAKMIRPFVPQAGDKIQTLCTPENTNGKGALADTVILPPLGTPTKQIEVFEERDLDPIVNPYEKMP